MIIFDADDPLVLNGTYDREGYTPNERKAQMRKAKQQPPQAPPPRPKDQALPGMADRAIRPLEAAAAEYRDLRDRRRALKASEDEAKAAVAMLMHRHGKRHYKRRGIEITVEAAEKITIAFQVPEPDKDDDDKPREERRRPPRPPDPTPEQEPPQPRQEPPWPPRELH